MVIFYSGNSSRDAVPEALMIERDPAIMLTFHDFYNRRVKDTMRRFGIHQANLISKNKATGPVLKLKSKRTKKNDNDQS